MCTVTIITQNRGIRLACNRDESRRRPAGLPPRIVIAGSRRAVIPIDPSSRGTWVAATDAGLVFTILNSYSAPRAKNAPLPKYSRGTMIPELMDASTLEEAFVRASRMEAHDYAPFHLVISDRQCFAEVHFDGRACLRTAPARRRGPLLFTSSGLGDELVDPPRRELFKGFFHPGDDWSQKQDAYHRHSWPDRRHLSVCMSRHDALTVSLTVVELSIDKAQMTYHPAPPDQEAEAMVKVVELRN